MENEKIRPNHSLNPQTLNFLLCYKMCQYKLSEKLLFFGCEKSHCEVTYALIWEKKNFIKIISFFLFGKRGKNWRFKLIDEQNNVSNYSGVQSKNNVYNIVNKYEIGSKSR
jgi:hypothetical protein